MISHDRAQELISARMDAPLTPAEHHELQAHLATCPSCSAFVRNVDHVAFGLQGMAHLSPSPAVSRAVMSAIRTENDGWGWLRRSLQTLSSPGMAVASSLALILAFSGALFLAMNAPRGGGISNQAVQPEETIAAVAEAPLPTEIPAVALAPEPTAVPTEAPTREAVPEPTATKAAGRTIAPAPTRAADKTPEPTATSVAIVAAAPTEADPVVESPPIQPVSDETVYEDPASDPALAMAVEEPAQSAEMAQEAVADAPVDEAPVASEEQIASEPPAEETVVQEIIEEPAAEPAVEEAVVAEEPAKEGDRKKDAVSEEPALEATRPVGPVPIEAIVALEGAGTAPDFSLPPAPLDPMLPNQDFLPVTPTPIPDWDGTPTPETSEPATQSESPQLAEAEDSSANLDVAALAPLNPNVADAISQAEGAAEADGGKKRNKRDRSDESGGSYESEQAAYIAEPLGWSGDSIDWQETLEEPVVLFQTTDTTTAAPAQVDESAAGTGESIDGDMAAAGTSDAEEPVRQIDPATGMEIDPATGYLIDPTTGYLLDRVNGRIIDPRTSYEVHPQTGLLIDPATGALLDPNTLAVVVPAGFGDDGPAYDPGSPEMRGQIETVVDDNYDNASIKLIPPTDGPTQPVGEIIVPTASGDAVEIS